MVGLRDISVVESVRHCSPPPQGRRRRAGGGTRWKEAGLMGVLLLALCLVGFNVLQHTRKQRTALRPAASIVEPDTQHSPPSSRKDTGKGKKGKGKGKRVPKPVVLQKVDTTRGGTSPQPPPQPTRYSSLEHRLQATAQKSCSFGDLDVEQPHFCTGPKHVPKGWEDLKDATGCDIFTVPFEPKTDAACLRLISDARNWKDIVPMKQRFDERTIKFKATFEDDRLHAIIKVPQKLFPFEAMSEVGSFYADRVMRTQRVPPTAWTHVPLARIHATVEKHADTFEMIPRFMKDSGVSGYREWIDKDFLQYTRHRGLILDNDPNYPGEEVIGVSVQLFIADVRPLLDSDLSIPWVAHNDSWQVHMSPAHPWEPRFAPGFIRQAELAMFDYVIGNGDRSPNKNNFVVGACRHHRHTDKCGKGPGHPGTPSFVTLDNGMMFFYELTAGRSPDGPNPLLKDTFCIFERKLLARLRELHDEGFSVKMQEEMPKTLKKFITRKLLHKCDTRLKKLLTQLESCIEKFGEEKVVVS